MGDKGHKGFAKRPVPLAMQVDAAEIQTMQAGYETRIARQKLALDRMTALLEQRTEDVHEHMRRANEAARWTGETLDDLSVMNAGRSASVSDVDVDELLKLIPDTWDLYNEDDTPRSVLAGYINFLKEEVKHQKGKQAAVMRQAGTLRRWVADRMAEEKVELGDAEADGFQIARHYIGYLERELAQARVDTRHNAKVANKAQAVMEIGDDTPPWEAGGMAFVAPATHDHEQRLPDQPDRSDSETVSWDGPREFTGEEKPGNSF